MHDFDGIYQKIWGLARDAVIVKNVELGELSILR